jgi:hypothetical protein|tara:strand:+ start:184 stop:738 length:555 start_codon:yes stop_codon:yes gene_type:complete
MEKYRIFIEEADTEVELSDTQLGALVSRIPKDLLDQFIKDNLPEESINENLKELIDTEDYAIVDEFQNLYEALQDAIDENSETPCPQCLYEILSDASCGCPDLIPEAEYRGRKVTLNKPMQGDVKKFKVYVKNAKGNVVKVNFGDKNMRIKKSNPKRRKSFRARHNCKSPGPKWKARYWSCRKW